MSRPGIRTLLLGAAGLVGITALVRRSRRVASGRSVEGGVVMGDVGTYDRLSRLLFGSLFRGVTADVVAAVPPPARVLEVGCGPGFLSIELARRGFTVTGMDLDAGMIDRARGNAERAGAPRGAERNAERNAQREGEGAARPTFIVADVADLPFDDATFDLVVSTFSMHHWADRAAGLAEIARVVRPGGRAVIWDLRPGSLPFHGPARGDTAHGHGAHGHGARASAPAPDSPLGPATVTPWRWPFRLILTDRFEFRRPAAADPVVGAAGLG